MRTAITTLLVAVTVAGTALADEPPPAAPPPAAPAPTTVAPTAKPDEGTAGARVRATDAAPAPVRRRAKAQTLPDPALEACVHDWPEASRQAVIAMYDKYGAPAGYTSDLVQWNRVGPWKRVTVTADAVDHAFPAAHQDVLAQTIGFAVPADKLDELAAFDGSVVVSRTRGELTAACDDEAMNFLVLNLAVDVIKEKKTVAQARSALDKAAAAYHRGLRDALTNRLLFELPRGSTRDPDAAAPQLSAR